MSDFEKTVEEGSIMGWNCENCGTRHKHPSARLCSECDTVERMSAAHDKEFADLETKLAAAEERTERAERERDEARLRSCQCGAEEACRYARERDKARALADTYRDELRLADTEAARLREALERITQTGCVCIDLGMDNCAQCIARAALAGEETP
jgi:chromosome segregation ATPase